MKARSISREHLARLFFSQVLERRTICDYVNNRGQSFFSEERIDEDLYKRTRFSTSRDFWSDSAGRRYIFESIRICSLRGLSGPVRCDSTDTTAEWNLTRIQLSPPRLTRPPREFLALWDIRVRRRTSPLWRPPAPLSPLARTPPRTPARVHRCVQARPSTSEKSIQTQPARTEPLATRSTGTQAEEPRRSDSAIQTSRADERPRTPTKTVSRPDRWGPVRHTKTQPTIIWRERR